MVHSVVGKPDLAIKVYGQGKVSDERRRKLRSMVDLASPTLAKHTAWPIDLIDNGALAVVMPRVSGIELHDLYGPKSRMAKMPHATFRFLITAAYNLCAALQQIHRAGAVVGDLNPRNILVSNTATVNFVDCDSFQIGAGRTLFRCLVGMPEHLAPELHGADFNKIIRSPNHDNFSLAILIFQLLFIGRHPFTGVGGPDELSEAVRNHFFYYGQKARARGLGPAPYVPPTDTVPASLFALFERAFADKSAHGLRPTPVEWGHQLDALRTSVVKCRINPAHEYLSARPTCPWCDLRVVFFISDGQQVFRIDAATIKGLVDKLEAALPDPYVFRLPVVGVVTPAPPPSNLDAKSAGFWFGLVLIGLAAVGLYKGQWFLAALVSIWAAVLLAKHTGGARRASFRRELAVEYARAEKEKNSIETTLCGIHSQYATEFKREQHRTIKLKEEYSALPSERQKEIDKLRGRLRELQFALYLDAKFISSARIPGIGQKRIAVLRGCGIETAADVSWTMRVPGFGVDLRRKLMEWRKECELGFRFDPSAQIDPREVQKIDAQLMVRRDKIDSELRSISDALHRLTLRFRADLETASADLPRVALALAQAKVNLAEFDKPPSTQVSSAPRKAGKQVVLIGGFCAIATIVAILIRPAKVEPRPIVEPAPATPPPHGTLVFRANIDARASIERIEVPPQPRSQIDDTALPTGQAINKDLPPGKYKLTFTADGWRHAKFMDVDVTTDTKKPIEVPFAKLDADFTSSPSGATVREGSVIIGTTPFRATGLANEERTFIFSATGRPDGIVTVSITDSTQTVAYSWPLGTIVIASTPLGADVWSAGNKLGKTPLHLPDTPIGDYRFTLTADGYESAEVSGTLTPNITLPLHCALIDARPGRLRVSVSSDGTRLHLENIGERAILLHQILVHGSGDSVIEAISADVNLSAGASADVRCRNPVTSQMKFSFGAEPNEIDATFQWEPPPEPPKPNPFAAKSIKVELDLKRRMIAFTNQADLEIAVKHLIITPASGRKPVKIPVEREVAPKQTVHIRLRMSLEVGDSLQFVTDPTLPAGTITFNNS